MHHAAQAYGKLAQTTSSPRELEATILLRAATKLQIVKDEWDVRSHELYDALTYNRKLWTILASAVSRPDHPLPKPIRQNIVNLALFIFQRTFDLTVSPDREGVSALVTINRQLAQGLRSQG